MSSSLGGRCLGELRSNGVDNKKGKTSEKPSISLAVSGWLYVCYVFLVGLV